MSVESDIQQAPGLSEDVAAAPAGNPALLGLITFLPGGITLGLWFLGYLGTTGGMVPAVFLCTGLFVAAAALWAARLGASPVAAIFGIFAGFWLSFGFLLMGATSGWWGMTDAAAVTDVQRTYLLSFLIVFVLLTLMTLRLPLMFTLGFVLVDITFALAFIAVAAGQTGLLTIAGITTFLFCAVFAYILADGMGQDLGAKPMALGNPIVR